MNFPERLKSGTLLRRYKRFLADVRTEQGDVRTMHCPNTGAMLGCSEPGSKVYFSTSANQARKYPHTLELVQTEHNHWVGVNPTFANKIVGEALGRRAIETLKDFETWRAEIAIPDEAGRFDFGIESQIYMEIKSVTYLHQGMGLFPDAKSSRATKHVHALLRQIAAGVRGVLFFCVPHTGVKQVSIADQIDPIYFQAVKQAMQQGLEVLAYRCAVNPVGITLTDQVPFTLDR